MENGGNEPAGADVALRPFVRVHADALATVRAPVRRARTDGWAGVLIGWCDDPTDTVSLTTALPVEPPASARGGRRAGPATEGASRFPIADEAWAGVERT